VPITFVCEEAHRYVPLDKTLGFEPTKRALSRIAKEGRKYGVSLCIVSQRPAELDPTILSQCNTIFSLRLTNERDQEILKAGISDAAASLLEFMPTMGTGEAISFGEGVALPTRIKFDLLPANESPKSNTASFTENWSRDLADETFLHEIVSRWRAQTFNPTSADYTVELPGQATPAAAAAPIVPQPQPVSQPQAAPQPRLQPAASATAPTLRPAAPPPPLPAAPAYAAPTPGQPTLRRMQPPPAQPGQGQRPAPSPPPAPPPAAPQSGQQQSLASLIRQFRS
jgi:hypothetical protein